ncbi:MAG: V-type ATPase subunit [bacterium]|nr:V-type ATPase subunit [bacterium]
MLAVTEEAARLNARVRAMKSRLFDRGRLNDLLDQGDLAVFIDVLLNSPYEVEMAEALTRARGADAVEEAVGRNLAATFGLLSRLAGIQEEANQPGVTRGSLTRTFFTRWDLTAVKSLVRLKHRSMESGEVARMVSPGPGLGVVALRQLAAADSVPALIGRLTTWNLRLGQTLSAALPSYSETNDPAVLEDALDRGYFCETLETLVRETDEDAALVRRVLQMEVDRINLRTLFRSVGTSERVPDERLLPGGTIPMRKLRLMAQAGDVATLMELLEPTPYRDLVEGLYQFVQTKRFGPMERMFESFILRYLKREARSNVFGLAVLVHYAWLKYNEAMDLRLIARGLARGLPRGLVREELLYG